MGNLHYPGLEGEGDAGAPRGQLDLNQAPDAIADLQGLIAHVLTLKGALGHSEGLNMKVNNNLTHPFRLLALIWPILIEMPSLVHSTFSIVYWISLGPGMSFQVPRNVFFSVASSVKKMWRGAMQAK